MAEPSARVTSEAAGEGERRWFVGTLATITVPMGVPLPFRVDRPES